MKKPRKKKLAPDIYAGKKIWCGICGSKIRKGQHYWYIGPWILCKVCHDAIHGEDKSEPVL